MTVRFSAAVVAGLFVLVVAACTDDDDTATTTTVSIESGGIEVDAPAGTLAVPIPSLGFGIALPENWQASVLTPAALEQLAEADTGQVAFVDAAIETASTGALFYAAGEDVDGRVSDLKVFREDRPDATLDDLRSLADDIAAGADAATVDEVDQDGRPGLVLRFTVDDATVDGEPVTTSVSQLFVADGDRVWSLVITTEDPATLDLLESIFYGSFTTG